MFESLTLSYRILWRWRWFPVNSTWGQSDNQCLGRKPCRRRYRFRSRLEFRRAANGFPAVLVSHDPLKWRAIPRNVSQGASILPRRQPLRWCFWMWKSARAALRWLVEAATVLWYFLILLASLSLSVNTWKVVAFKFPLL